MKLGLQRFCTEHKIKLSKIDHIFLSRVCSETAGGIPGLLLTLAGMGDEGMSVNIWGPSDLQYLVDAMKSFIPHAAMVHTTSFGSDATAQFGASNFTDPIVLVDNEVVKISALLLRPSCSKGSAVKPGDMSVIYLCELPEIMGKFDPVKAKALGLNPGPKYSELQSGQSVKSDRQNIMVHPSDVMGPSIPGPIVFLVDCPTESHVEELLFMQFLHSYYADYSGNQSENEKTVTCIIHLGPASVISSPNYQKWMKNFGSAQHIMAGNEMKNVEIPILKSSARIAARLNYLCPQFFPAPGIWSLKQLKSSKEDYIYSGEVCVSKSAGRILAENLLKFTLRPHAHLGLDKSNIPSLMAPSEVINELLTELPEIVDAAQHVRQFWHSSGEVKRDIAFGQDNNVMIEEPWLGENIVPSCLENIRRDDMEIVLLGTGSSQPSKYRNVSSVYINLFSKGVKTESTLFARGSRMQSYWKRPGNLVDNNAFALLSNLKKVLNDAGLETLISFPVVHCPQAFGVVLTASERINSVGKVIPGWKIVYSGDTRPCPELVEASHGATVLATFEDDLMDEAVAKNHSTTKEAIEVGNLAGAYRIILTHFSQRYPKIPVFDESHMHKTCIAFDMMSVNVADLPVVPRVLPYLKLLFKNEMVVDELDDVNAVSAFS
ncbi:zinc phosphodiesterase, putative [Ricinus communis]|uniref:ribonuclease Z n=1 Tax=Ricinus communis TaxID=3988 RepID=B9RQH8_RICCO|nr:zinc phosphodiesterase, putative [Ricinus communis]